VRVGLDRGGCVLWWVDETRGLSVALGRTSLLSLQCSGVSGAGFRFWVLVLGSNAF
jgi:hypothetical protein